jgi:Tfp pilus assembly protein PilN
MNWPALALDFVAPRRPRRVAGYALLAAALLVVVAELDRFRDTQDGLRRLEAAEMLLTSTRPAAPLQREPLDAQLKQAQSIVRQLALPWAQMIESLESAARPGVALLQIQPDAERRLLRVTAEARTPETMFDYVRRLENARGFSAVHLVHHQVQLEHPRQPLQFAVQASFGGAP